MKKATKQCDKTNAKLVEVSWQGFAAYQLENSQLALVVVPALGGKIASLIWKGSGREWLWSNPYIEAREPKYGDSYTREFDLGGFDECFPSVAKTSYPEHPWLGKEISDHGELWSQEWQSETIILDGTIEVKMVAKGVNVPYVFERTISLKESEPTLSLSYAVHNLSNHAIPFIWCAHPTLAVKPGMQLSIPVPEMTVYSSVNGRFGNLAAKHSWPELIGTNEKFDLSRLPDFNTGMAVKLYGKAPVCGRVSIKEPESGDSLMFSFNPEEVTHIGLWLNFNGWSGLENGTTYYNLAIEPAIGAQDDLSLAYNRFGEYGTVPANNSVTWSLDVTLSGENMKKSSEHAERMHTETEIKEDGRLITYYHFQKSEPALQAENNEERNDCRKVSEERAG